MYLQTALSHGFNFSIAKLVSAASEGPEGSAFAKIESLVDPWNSNTISKKNLIILCMMETMFFISSIQLTMYDVDSYCSMTHTSVTVNMVGNNIIIF